MLHPRFGEEHGVHRRLMSGIGFEQTALGPGHQPLASRVFWSGAGKTAIQKEVFSSLVPESILIPLSIQIVGIIGRPRHPVNMDTITIYIIIIVRIKIQYLTLSRVVAMASLSAPSPTSRQPSIHTQKEDNRQAVLFFVLNSRLLFEELLEPVPDDQQDYGTNQSANDLAIPL